MREGLDEREEGGGALEVSSPAYNGNGLN